MRLPRLFSPDELRGILDSGYGGDAPVIALEDAATGVHELAHYLQFYGTLFGNFYLHMTQKMSVCIRALFKHARDKTGLAFPAMNWNFDIREVFPDDKWMAFYRLGIFSNRYANEELHGMAYTVNGIHPVPLDEGFAQTSPLWLEMADGGKFPFTGSVLLENAAVCHECHFVAGGEQKHTEPLIQFYGKLPPKQSQLYNGLAVWFAMANISHIEPLLYFTLLNQPCEDFYENLGNYTLAQNTKRVLMRSEHLSDMPRPKTDDQVREAFRRIAKVLDLRNPLESVEQYRDYVRQSIAGAHTSSEDASWIVDFVACCAFDYFLENPLDIIEWPRNTKKLVRNVPVLNITSDGSEERHASLVAHDKLDPASMTALLNWHLEYCRDLHMLFGLYREPTVACPHWMYRAPSMCDLCGTCNGFLPNESLDTVCPVVERYGDILQITSHQKKG